MALIKFLAIFLLLYFGLKILGRVFRNSTGASNRRTSGGRTPNEVRPDGDVRIEYTNPEKAKRKKDAGEGEYVDFEELD